MRAFYSNGANLTKSYDLQYRITQNKQGKFINANYNYDNETNITAISGTYNRTYVYDDIYRLRQASGSWGNKEYTYDKNSNRLTKVINSNSTTYNYQTGTNRLISTVGYENDSFIYNNRGDIIEDSNYYYNYGDHKRLISIIEKGTMETVATYNYDYKLRRINRLSQGMWWNIFYDQQDRMINETNELGYSMDYIYLGIEPIAKIEYNWAVDHLYFYHNDHLMTPLKMTSDSSQIVWQAEYYPFGKLYSENGPVSNNIRFPGQYDDKIPSTSLYYNWNRFYNPIIGRYNELDPIGIDSSNTNIYQYANNNIINNYDITGLISANALNPKECSCLNWKGVEDSVKSICTEDTKRKASKMKKCIPAYDCIFNKKCKETINIICEGKGCKDNPYCAYVRSSWTGDNGIQKYSPPRIVLCKLGASGQAYSTCGPVSAVILAEMGHLCGYDKRREKIHPHISVACIVCAMYPRHKFWCDQCPCKPTITVYG